MEEDFIFPIDEEPILIAPLGTNSLNDTRFSPTNVPRGGSQITTPINKTSVPPPHGLESRVPEPRVTTPTNKDQGSPPLRTTSSEGPERSTSNRVTGSQIIQKGVPSRVTEPPKNVPNREQRTIIREGTSENQKMQNETREESKRFPISYRQRLIESRDQQFRGNTRRKVSFELRDQERGGTEKKEVINAEDIQEQFSNSIPLRWNSDYSRWNLQVIRVPGDSHCLFHSICRGFYAPYIQEIKDGEKISRLSIVKQFRDEVATRLTSVQEGTDKTVYETLYGGSLAQQAAESVSDYSLKNMQETLRTNSFIGHAYLQLISDSIDKDIYILDLKNKDIYISHELLFSCRGNRPSIIILYDDVGQHYDLIGIKDVKGIIWTLLSPRHSFVMFLFGRIKELINP